MKRNMEKLSNSDFSPQFKRVYSHVARLRPDNLPFANRVIEDLQTYMRTVVGTEIRMLVKDRCSIDDIELLRKRLSDVEALAYLVEKAQGLRNESILIEGYKQYQQATKTGTFPRSNLKNL